jgi:hypothetical protein
MRAHRDIAVRVERGEDPNRRAGLLDRPHQVARERGRRRPEVRTRNSVALVIDGARSGLGSAAARRDARALSWLRSSRPWRG